jgi:hypothetical protein
MTIMKNYVVRTAGEVCAIWREPKVPFPLTDDQARELTPPFGDVVEVVTIEKDASNGKVNRPERRKRKSDH